MNIEKDFKAWGFVEKYYPGYHNSNDIAYNMDLCKLLNDEHEKDDNADQLLKNSYGGDLDKAYHEILSDYQESMMKIYQEAILAYIEQHETAK